METKIEKLIKLHERGLLTEAEVVNEFLLTAANVVEVQSVKTLFLLLPIALQSAVRSRLNELHGSGFNWRPFMIGEGLSEVALERLRGQLRAIHERLSESD